MAEIKIKIDSSDIDAAIAKVSHLLELVERLPAGLLGTGTESKEVQSESVKVFINEAFINKKAVTAANVSEVIENAIANSNEFEKLKASEHRGGGYIRFPDEPMPFGGFPIAKRTDEINKSEIIDSPTCDTLAIYHCVRDALHRFEAKLDGMKDEPAANSAALTEKIRDSITNAVSVGGGASAHQAIRNR